MPGGLLGADYEIANGRYRFKKIYTGESWNPQLRAPLAGPGLNVKAGDYLLAVNGQDLTGSDDISRLAGRHRRKARRAAGGDRRRRARMRARSTVTPVASEQRAAQPGVDRRQSPQGG